MSIKKIHFTTLGCPKNLVDTEVMAKLVREQGIEITQNPDEADLIAVNTCAFLQASQEESISTVLNLSRFKKDGTCQKLVVTGCLASRHPQDIQKALPEVDHFLGTGDLHKIVDLIGDQKQPVNLITSENSSPLNDKQWNTLLGERLGDGAIFSRYLKIAEGCDRSCTFCIIPTLRGPQRSRTIPSLVEEAQALVQSGAREINLIAQDLTAYGHDLAEPKRLEDLLEALVKIPGLKWLRLHYMYPQRISERLIDLIAAGGPILPYLDMPLQHVSTAVLQRMKRGTTAEKQRELVKKLRARIPGLVLRSTMIVGFPGETEAQFEELLEFIREARFDHLGAFKYSREEGTAAAELDGQIDEATKERRWQKLMAVQNEISRENNEARCGATIDALVIGPSQESEFLIEARGWHQAPDIDGVTYITDLGPTPPPLKAGDFVKIRVTQTHDYDLAGALA